MKQRESEWDLNARSARLTRRQAAIGCAKADVVHWLHRDRRLLDCARTAQELSFEDTPDEPTQGMVLRRVADHLGPQLMAEFQQWARRTHFWCELLAQMAYALAQYEKVRGRIFRMVENTLLQQDEQPVPDALRHAGAIGSAVQWSWRYVLASVVAASGAGSLATLLAGGDVQRLLWPIRVIAVLMCPDAARHAAVREHCWEPIVRLARAEVRDTVRERLTRAFGEDPWFTSPDASGSA
ncbi:hypothetical protein [Actinomadura decatromicini]|uniref:Uncharacterized protein n=1 Tax=Actinomadura decatromicini TaxID=2604572 RepID=A0A5D3F4I1_9ACTN|nr:hypothetical protein [Actinomadura decatromicini]TYK43092.1 hypothetical protein FXF68_40140 [Actinomadura decatromicini]